MKAFIKPARAAFCIGLAGMVIPQLFYSQFGPNFFPAWPGLPWGAFWSYLFTALIITACAAVVLEKNGRTASLILGALLLAVYCCGYIPYELAIEPHNNYLGSWADGLKEPALAGGAFVMAGSFPGIGGSYPLISDYFPVTGESSPKDIKRQSAPLIKFLEKLIPLGPVLFCITMILYGICHFLYGKFISALVPAWFPGGRMFWTYFAAVALIGSGIAISLRIKRKLASTLLGIMIFIWLIIIHIPFAVADPFGQNSNSLVSAFSALAFSATAFLITSIKDRTVARKTDDDPMIGDDTIIIATEIGASLEDCWKAWTEPAFVLKWFGSDPNGKGLGATLDVRVGGTYKVMFANSDQTVHSCSGMYIQVKPFEKLVFNWEWESEPGVVSLVKLSFKPKGSATWMQFEHAYVGSRSAHDYRIGWQNAFTKLQKIFSDQETY